MLEGHSRGSGQEMDAKVPWSKLGHDSKRDMPLPPATCRIGWDSAAVDHAMTQTASILDARTVPDLGKAWLSNLLSFA